jgi:hypothetical protein
MNNLLRKNDSAIIVIAPAVLLAEIIVSIAFTDFDPGMLHHSHFLECVWPGQWHQGWFGWNLLLCGFVAFIALVQINRTTQQWNLLGILSNYSLWIASLAFLWIHPENRNPIFWTCVFFSGYVINAGLSIISEADPHRPTFNSAFITGCLGLLEPAFLLLLGTIMVSLIISRTFSVRTLGLAITGLVLPFYIVVATRYLVYPEVPLSSGLPHWPGISWSKGLTPTPWLFEIALCAGAMMVLRFTGATVGNMRDKKKWQFIVITAFLGIALGLILGPPHGDALFFIPAVIVISRLMLSKQRKWVHALFFYTLMALTLWNLFAV